MTKQATKKDSRERAFATASQWALGEMLERRDSTTLVSVYMVIAKHVNGKTGDAWPSHETIGKLLGHKDRKWAIKPVKTLVDLGVVHRRPRPDDGRAYVYSLADPPTGWLDGDKKVGREYPTYPSVDGEIGRENPTDFGTAGEIGREYPTEIGRENPTLTTPRGTRTTTTAVEAPRSVRDEVLAREAEKQQQPDEQQAEDQDTDELPDWVTDSHRRAAADKNLTDEHLAAYVRRAQAPDVKSRGAWLFSAITKEWDVELTPAPTARRIPNWQE